MTQWCSDPTCWIRNWISISGTFLHFSLLLSRLWRWTSWKMKRWIQTAPRTQSQLSIAQSFYWQSNISHINQFKAQYSWFIYRSMTNFGLQTHNTSHTYITNMFWCHMTSLVAAAMKTSCWYLVHSWLINLSIIHSNAGCLDLVLLGKIYQVDPCSQRPGKSWGNIRGEGTTWKVLREQLGTREPGSGQSRSAVWLRVLQLICCGVLSVSNQRYLDRFLL